MRETELDKKHIPVLFTELTQIFEIRNDKKNIIIDGTLGIGGHAEEIIKKLNPLDVFVGFDADIKNLELAKIRLKNTVEKSKAKVFFINSNFVNLKEELKKIGIKSISGIYFDLGLSSLHIDEAERGFSFMKDGPLDMRLDKSSGITAKEIVNSYTASELRDIFLKFGEEPGANKISKIILEERKIKKIERTLELASIIPGGIKTKSRIFQAIRIEVNNELKNLEKTLNDAIDLLDKNGIIFVISFHSLEDRITKNIFRIESKNCICEDLICSCKHKKQLKILTKKPIIPSENEIKENPRSRSAKARAAKKI